MLRDTLLTTLAMLAAERGPDHACNTEVGLIKLPQLKQLINDGLLLGDAIHLGDETGIVAHSGGIEVGSKA